MIVTNGLFWDMCICNRSRSWEWFVDGLCICNRSGSWEWFVGGCVELQQSVIFGSGLFWGFVRLQPIVISRVVLSSSTDEVLSFHNQVPSLSSQFSQQVTTVSETSDHASSHLLSAPSFFFNIFVLLKFHKCKFQCSQNFKQLTTTRQKLQSKADTVK